MADRSEFGWLTFGEYLSDELASNSEDEKRIFRSERRAERRSKQAASRHRVKAKDWRDTKSSANLASARFASPSGIQFRDTSSRIGPCYKLSQYSLTFSVFKSLLFSFVCSFTFLLCLLLAVLVTGGTLQLFFISFLSWCLW